MQQLLTRAEGENLRHVLGGEAGHFVGPAGKHAGTTTKTAFVELCNPACRL